MKASLIVLDGRQRGSRIPLPETILLIGRDAQCHVRPHCPSVSKLHCAIAAWAGIVRLRDLRSRNGTFLNGKPVDGEIMVRDGDHLRIGTLEFTFSIQKEDGSLLPAPVSEREVQWLLDSPADLDALAVGRTTSLVTDMSAAEIPETLATSGPITSGESSHKRPSKVVSAGQYLRDYLEQQKVPTR